jgi:hypothetical protein
MGAASRAATRVSDGLGREKMIPNFGRDRQSKNAKDAAAEANRLRAKHDKEHVDFDWDAAVESLKVMLDRLYK